MRRLIFALPALIAALASIIPVFAQTPAASPAASPEAMPYTGLVEGVTRQYTPDPTKAPADDPAKFVLVSVHLFRFDTEAHAAASYKILSEDATSPLANAVGSGEGAPEIHQGEVDDLGDRAWAVWLSAKNPSGDTGHYRLLYVQNGDYLILATAIGGTEKNTMLADEIARAITERDAGSEKPSFSPDGTSTGGIWNKLPATGDDAAHGLTAFADQQIALP